MTVELKSTFIPADLHKWLKLLAVENETTVAIEHERALREAQAARQQNATKNTKQTTAVAQ